ncbi:MAG: HAMP domain-containing histidine kinase [Chloroflexi bacterium]|uniref:sensor histidine kinase n=1 Tax=Candidatus Flexifilum breve TaxID=3140694 RepID=UPI003134E72D|nr:HAMP domain-containing histidine kinase [Chloroflexota bacterium]
MLREFIAKVGHDFKTPLAVINTSSFLLQRLDDGEKRSAQSSRIQQQVRLISQMLDDILEFVALERELVLNYSLVDLRPLIQDVIDEHASALTRRSSSEVSSTRQPSSAWTASRSAAHSASCSKNAIQYTPGGRICVSAIRYPEEIGIRVQDSGMGISSLAIDKVFKPLYRADEARTDRRTGLGLPIAKTIVEAHHGRIILESMQGQGSTFGDHPAANIAPPLI